jgi:hypothetical protein
LPEPEKGRAADKEEREPQISDDECDHLMPFDGQRLLQYEYIGVFFIVWKKCV